MNAAIRAGSLMPLAALPSGPIASTPLDTSTAHGRTRRIASPTFAAVSPPESTTRPGQLARGSAPQSNVCPVPPGRPPDGGASNSSPPASAIPRRVF